MKQGNYSVFSQWVPDPPGSLTTSGLHLSQLLPTNRSQLRSKGTGMARMANTKYEAIESSSMCSHTVYLPAQQSALGTALGSGPRTGKTD